MKSYEDTINKRDFRTSGLKVATGRAQRKADARNEPTYLIEGKKEYFIADDTDFRYIDDWGSRDWPMWAKEDYHAGRLNVLQTFFPEDSLADSEKKAEKIAAKMAKMAQSIRYELKFDLDQMCRDYPDVRRQLALVQSGAEHLSTLIVYLESDVREATRHHKKHGQREIETNGPLVIPPPN